MDSEDGNIVNFSSFRKISREERKRRDRAAKETAAAANRIRFGRTGAEKKLTRLQNERAARVLEGARRSPSSALPGDTDVQTDNTPGETGDKPGSGSGPEIPQPK